MALSKIIRDEGPGGITVKKCIAEALRLHPPAYIMGRALRKDKLLTLRGPGKTLLWSKLLRKGHYAVSWIYGAGRNPYLYPHPDVFNPLRFDTPPAHLPWLPFTSGQHTCPGQFLARSEMESFTIEFLKRYEIHNPKNGNSTRPITLIF